MAQTTHLSADRLVVTDGRRQYRVHRPWARLPNGREFGRISQVAVARDGRVVVVQRDALAVLLFAPDGELDNTWHHRKLDSVHGVAAAPDGSLLITSFDLHQVLRFDLDGHLLQELGTESGPRWGQPFNHPTDVAVDPRNGDFVVSDGYGNARLHRFDQEGRLLHSWEEPGSGVGQFACPHGVWIMHDGSLSQSTVTTTGSRYLLSMGGLSSNGTGYAARWTFGATARPSSYPIRRRAS